MAGIVDCFRQKLEEAFGESASLVKAILEAKGCAYNGNSFFFLTNPTMVDEEEVSNYASHIECKFTDLIDKESVFMKIIDGILKSSPYTSSIFGKNCLPLISPPVAGNPFTYFNFKEKEFVDFIDLADIVLYFPVGLWNTYYKNKEDGSAVYLGAYSPIIYLRNLNLLLNVNCKLSETQYRIFDAVGSNEDYSWLQYLTLSLNWHLILQLGRILQDKGNIYHFLTLFQRVDLDTGDREIIGYFIPTNPPNSKYAYKDILQNVISKNPYMGNVDRTKPILNWVVKDPQNTFIPNDIEIFPIIETEEGLHYYWASYSVSDPNVLTENVFGNVDAIPTYVFVKDASGNVFGNDFRESTLWFDGQYLYMSKKSFEIEQNTEVSGYSIYKIDLEQAKNNKADIDMITMASDLYSILFVGIYPLVMRYFVPFGTRLYSFPIKDGIIVLSNSKVSDVNSPFVIYKNFACNIIDEDFVQPVKVDAQVVENQNNEIGITVGNNEDYINFKDYGTIDNFIKDLGDTFFQPIPDSYDNDKILQEAFETWSYFISQKYISAVQQILDKDSYLKFENMFRGVELTPSRNYLPFIVLQVVVMVSTNEQLQKLREFNYQNFDEWLNDNPTMPQAFRELQKKIREIVQNPDDWEFGINFLVIKDSTNDPNYVGGISGEIILRKKTPIARLSEQSPVRIERPAEKISL